MTSITNEVLCTPNDTEKLSRHGEICILKGSLRNHGVGNGLEESQWGCRDSY